MNSSGIKRGLAASAVAALAVTGLATSASATSINDQVSDVTLFSQSTGKASVKDDGVDAKVRLSAGAPATVANVTFQYRLSAGAQWQSIETVARNEDGAFSYDWAPGALLGATADIRAIDAAQPAQSASAADAEAAAVTLNVGAPESVALTAGSALGYFAQPGGGRTIAVTGTASAAPSDVEAIGTPSALVPAATIGWNSTAKTFGAVLDINGYTFGATNQIVLGAKANGGDSDAVEAYTLYQQTITSVTAVSDKEKVASPATAKVTVTVKDQNDKPIAGVVVSQNGTAVSGTTDSNGQVVVSGLNAGTYSFHANADAGPAYDAGAGDKKATDVVISNYVAKPASIEGVTTPALGSAFDEDETGAGSVTVNFKDNEGQPITVANRTLNYYWVVTPFDGSAAVRAPLTGTTNLLSTAFMPTANGGSASIAIPGSVDGTYELYAGLSINSSNGDAAVPSAKVLTFKRGDAVATFDAGAEINAPKGTSATVTGELELADGTVLPNRALNPGSVWNKVVTGDAVEDPSTPTASLKTDAAGKFTVKINDPAATPPAATPTEFGGQLTVGQTGVFTPKQITVNFVTDVAPADSVLTVTPDDGIGGVANTPGKIQPGTLHLEDASGNDLAGVQVKLTTDHGYFTTGTPVSTAPGTLEGTYKEAGTGTTLTVVTDSDGDATFKTVIGRDAGFDTNGKLTANVKAEVGAVTKTGTIAFDTANPLNVKEVTVTRLADQLAVNPTGTMVGYDLDAKDGFDNPVAGVGVTVTPETVAPGSGIVLGTSGSKLSDFEPDADIQVVSNKDGEYTFDVVSTGTGSAYNNANSLVTVAAPAGATPTQISEEWYTLDLAAGSYTLTAPATATVGDTVLVTAKAVDQKGNPVVGATVEFVRTGDANQSVTTDANGQAVYAFKGTEKGAQTVTAVFRAPAPAPGADGAVLDTESVTIDFVKAAGSVTAKLIGHNGAKGKDKLAVSTNADKGTLVKFFRITKNGNTKKVAERFVNKNGRANASVKDHNGKKKTTYFARVLAEAGKVKTNNKKVK